MAEVRTYFGRAFAGVKEDEDDVRSRRHFRFDDGAARHVVEVKVEGNVEQVCVELLLVGAARRLHSADTSDRRTGRSFSCNGSSVIHEPELGETDG